VFLLRVKLKRWEMKGEVCCFGLSGGDRKLIRVFTALNSNFVINIGGELHELHTKQRQICDPTRYLFWA
jgi:hypothetical protein